MIESFNDMSNKNQLKSFKNRKIKSRQWAGERERCIIAFSVQTLQMFIILLQKMLVYILWSAVQRRVNRLGLGENKKVFLLTVRWYCLQISGQASAWWPIISHRSHRFLQDNLSKHLWLEDMGKEQSKQ